MTGPAVERSATFTLDELDLRRANRLAVLGRARDDRTRLASGLAFLWVVSLLPLLVRQFGGPDSTSPELVRGMILFGAAATGLSLAIGIGLPLALGPMAISRRFQQEKLLSQPVSARWDEQAYEAEQPGIHNRFLWSDYAKWREDGHVFLFMLSEYNFQVLPKRVLSAAQIADLQAILATVKD